MQKFVVALTQGGPSGQVFRAIDLHAHDSVRYVGDMLAWMHQTVASEEEFLEAVFGEAHSNDRSSRKDEDEANSNALTTSITSKVDQELVGLSIQELLARSLQGLGRPLRVRIMQVSLDGYAF